MKFRLVQLVEGQWIVSDFSAENAIPAIELRGFTFRGIKTGHRLLREELRDQPAFDGLAGPAWGGIENGEVIIRYEDWKAYDRLST